MNIDANVITVNGREYVDKSSLLDSAEVKDGMKYVIVRTQSAGVFAGYIESRNGREVKMKDARRIWYWAGAASLSQLAKDGTSNPKDCKFPCEVSNIELLDAIEILDVTEKARKSIKAVKVWEQ